MYGGDQSNLVSWSCPNRGEHDVDGQGQLGLGAPSFRRRSQDGGEPFCGPDEKKTLRNRGRGKARTVHRILVLLNLDDGERSQIIEASPNRDVSFRDLQWSSSGKYASFVEVDRTDVPLRTVLVPTDPSYPGTATRRFARVGETIESLRVGIILSLIHI